MLGSRNHNRWVIKGSKELLIPFVVLLIGAHVVAQPARTFRWKGENFLLNGKPFIIRSGEMHYPRVPRIYWRDRFKKAKATGLNTITTYVFWNLHEPKPGRFDFSGNLDVGEFVRQAGEEGLYVIVRPGPYICTEWDFGGLPAWLLADREMQIRSINAKFLGPARRYMAEVGKRLAPLQITRGGNIIMAQIENEYGQFGHDKEYLRAIRQMIVDAGFVVPLFTSDYVTDEKTLAAGTLPDVLPVLNFGVVTTKDIPAVAKQFETLEAFRQDIPRMAGEYWVGWFDHWGAKKRVISPESAAEGVDWMLQRGISFNLYMFHGGTSFGFMNGASRNRQGVYQPVISSYDYDAPLDEAGNPTRKYFLIREVIRKHLPPGEDLPEVPVNPHLIEIPSFELKRSGSLFSLLKAPVRSERTLPMEELGQNYGFVFYRKNLDRDFDGRLKFDGVRDYAQVFIDRKLIGKLDRRLGENEIAIIARKGQTLGILVENHGRLNIGKEMGADRKGLVGSVWAGTEELKNWEIFSLPLNELSRALLVGKTASLDGPAFYRGSFTLREVGDTFLDMTTLGKGHVWVNGHHLGRFWRIGPQQNLFTPANWVKKGRNEVIVLEVESMTQPSIRGSKTSIFANQ